MTHSKGVEHKDVGGDYDGAKPMTGHTRRFTLHLTDHTQHDSFDEFSYIELLNSDLHEGLSSFAVKGWHGEFYMNKPDTIDFHLSENQSVSEISVRKKLKLITRCLSQDSQEMLQTVEAADIATRVILKEDDVLPEEVSNLKLPVSVSSCLATLNLAGSVLPGLGVAGNMLPTLIDTHSTKTAQDRSSHPPEIHTLPAEGLLHQICPPTLPDNLPLQLCDVINQIKLIIGSSEYLLGLRCGRLRFTKEINELLVQVENLSQSVTSVSRDMVFNYLASLLSCEPELLSKRAKKLYLAQNGDVLKDPISRLKEEIQSVMPFLIERHNEEILAAERLLLLQLETKECSTSRVTNDGRADDEVQDFIEDRMKRIVFPRKKFRWNHAVRMRLCEVVRLKMQQFRASKIPSQTAEEYLKAFLDAEIKKLWPRGWIQTRMLFKESRASHQQWTMSLPKLKRICVSGNEVSRNSSCIVQETAASGSSIPIITPSSISVCTVQAKKLMDFAKTSCTVKSLEVEDGTGFGRFSRRAQATNNQTWCTQLERISKTDGSGVSIPSPAPILSPTQATKYWLLKAALESKTDSRGGGLHGASSKTDALASIPVSSVAVASAASSTICCETAVASSVKIETERSSEFLKPSSEYGGSGVIDRSAIADGSRLAYEIGPLQTHLQEPLHHLKLATTTISHPTLFQSKPMDSKFGFEKQIDNMNLAGKQQSLSSSCSRFPSIFVFPSGTPLVGVMFCRAPMTSLQPFLAASADQLRRAPTDSTVMRSLLCGTGTTESLSCPVSSSQAPNVAHLSCQRNDINVELNVKQTVTDSTSPEESPMLTSLF